jgi:hypothetical protein
MNKLCLLGAAALIATAFLPDMASASAVVEECVAVEAVGSTVAGWAAVSGAVGWVAVFAGVQSAAAFGEGR